MKIQANYLLICIGLLFFYIVSPTTIHAKILDYSIGYQLINTNFALNKINNNSLTNTVTYNSIVTNRNENSLNNATATENENLVLVRENSYKYVEDFNFGKGILFGFIITMILLNLAGYFLFNEKLFLYFSGLVSSTASVFWLFNITSGVASGNLFFQTVSILFLGCLWLVFAYFFLSLNKFSPSIKTPSYIAVGISILLILSGILTKNVILFKIANALTISAIGLYFVVGITLFSKKNYVKFYVIATAIPLLFMIDYFVLQPFNINFLGTTLLHIEVATVFEILILTYAILFRMNSLTEEIEIKKTEMKIFLKQQDTLMRSNVERLVEDVYLENLIMHYDLTGLEVKLLQYISEGKSNKKISRKLKLSDTEVKEYTQTLYEKLEINERVQEDHSLVASQPDYIYN